MSHAFQRASRAEVHQDERSVGTTQHVGGLDVAVHDPVLVQVAEDLQQLPRDGPCLRLVDRAGAQAIGERFPLDELLGQVEPQGWTLAFAERLDEPRDLGMGDGLEHLRFPLKCIELLRRRDQGEDQLLERHHAGRSLRAIRPAVRGLRQDAQHAVRACPSSGSARATAGVAERSGARRTSRNSPHRR